MPGRGRGPAGRQEGRGTTLANARIDGRKTIRTDARTPVIPRTNTIMKRIALRSTISLRALSLATIPLIAAACAVGSEPVQDSGNDLANDEFVNNEVNVDQTALARFKERLERNPYGALSGMVTKLDGTPIANVTVRVGGETTKTDEKGAYSLDRVALGSWVVSFDHPSYVFAQKRATVDLAEPGWLTQELLPRAKSHHINAGDG